MSNISSPKAAHTPGPWAFGKTHEGQRLILGTGYGTYVCSVQIHQVPRHCGLYQEAEREANANLITAAPELLEALKAVAALLPEEDIVRALAPDSGLGIRRYPLDRGLTDAAIVSIYAAIRKAEGGAK